MPDKVARFGKYLVRRFVAKLLRQVSNPLPRASYYSAECGRGATEFVGRCIDCTRNLSSEIGTGHDLLIHISLQSLLSLRAKRGCCFPRLIPRLLRCLGKRGRCLPRSIRKSLFQARVAPGASGARAAVHIGYRLAGHHDSPIVCPGNLWLSLLFQALRRLSAVVTGKERLSIVDARNLSALAVFTRRKTTAKNFGEGSP
jgi:hypothetical protein